MRAIPFDKRPSGIAAAGDLPWGRHFGQFYETRQDLLDLLVPFLKAGLEHNELRSWVVSAPLDVAEARRALAAAVPDLSACEARGQIEIVGAADAPLARADAGEAITARIDQAIFGDFDGFRLAAPALPESGGRAFRAPGVEVVARNNALAAFAYPRVEVDALGFMEIVKNHSFALVRNAGRWEVIESSEVRTVQDALQRSEEKLQSLFRSMSEGFAYHRIVLDGDRKPGDYVFLEVNPAFERMTGLRAQDILGRRVTTVLPGIERDPTDWIGKYGRVAMTGEPTAFESHAAPLDRWYAVSAFSPHKGYFAVTFADITDRKRAEAERQAIRERLEVTLRSIGDGVISTDPAGRVAMLNHVAEELMGWSQAEAEGRPLAEVFRIVNDQTAAPAEDPVRKVLERGVVVGMANHTALLARDGRRIAIADSAAPVRGASGEMLGVVLVFRDVTLSRQAERERDITVDFLRLVNANTTMTDLIRGAVLFFHEQSGCEAVGIRLRDGDDYPYFEARGFPREFVLGENELCARDGAGNVRRDSRGDPVIECMCGNVICGRVDPAKPFFTPGGSFWANDTTRLLATSSDADRQARTRNRCNGEGYESVALVPLRVGAERLGLLQANDRRKGMFSPGIIAFWERLAGHLAVAVARARAAEELRRSEQDLLRADRHKNEFLAVLSHELRNPLAPIKNSLYILDRAAPGGDQAKRAQAVIERQVGQLARLVDDLLDVTRITQQKIHLQRQRLELNELVRRAAEDQRSLFEKSGVRLEVTTAAEQVLVNADWQRLSQVVGNLLQNAAKFTATGGSVKVSVAAERATRRAVVRIADTGVGMTPDVVEHLFQPFMQADRTLDRSKGGLGLGLALVKGLMELHGGEVTAHSDGLGKGSEFVVRLGLEDAAPAGRLTDRLVATRRSRRVLVIEDNLDAAESLRESLQLGGHVVEIAGNGPEGLVCARKFGPEVVLCDIGLPRMDGFEVARAFRADEAFRGIFLVALSGYALPEDLQRATEAGFQKHLAKPASIEAIEELLGGLD